VDLISIIVYTKKKEGAVAGHETEIVKKIPSAAFEYIADQ